MVHDFSPVHTDYLISASSYLFHRNAIYISKAVSGMYD